MKMIKWIFLIATFILLLGCDIFKDNPDKPPFTYNSALEGYVNFEEGTPDTISAKVQAYQMGQTTLMGETFTDTAGYYFIDKLSSGNYQLNISADNYDDFTLTDIILNPYDTTKADTVCLTLIKEIEIRTVIIDGAIDDGWEQVYENTHLSCWSETNNFNNLYLARDADSLYIAVNGGFDGGGNTVNIYIDKDYGEGTGINDFSGIQGGGYGNHLRKLVTTPESFGADIAFSEWALSSEVGIVSLEDPTAVDQHILNANISLNNSVIEIAIPFSEIYGNGVCPVGTKIALVAMIGGGGDDVMANDTIPQQEGIEVDQNNVVHQITFMTVFSRQY